MVSQQLAILKRMRPPPIYPKKIQALIRRLKTPIQVQGWLNSLRYNPGHTMRTLSGVVKSKSAHCLEAAMAAAAILEHHGPAQHGREAPRAGYPPLILDIESTDLLDHTLFLYRRRGKYGAIGKSRDIGLAGRKPVFKTIHALIQSYAIPYIDHHAAIKTYGVLDLRQLSRQTWRGSLKNVWYVEEALRHIPHTKLTRSRAITKKWRARYRAYKKKYPTRQPDYYPGQAAWM